MKSDSFNLPSVKQGFWALIFECHILYVKNLVNIDFSFVTGLKFKVQGIVENSFMMKWIGYSIVLNIGSIFFVGLSLLDLISYIPNSIHTDAFLSTYLLLQIIRTQYIAQITYACFR